MNEYIKECPHCGGEAAIWSKPNMKGPNGYYVVVICEVCGCRSKSYYCEEDPVDSEWDNESVYSAIKNWNRRPKRENNG